MRASIAPALRDAALDAAAAGCATTAAAPPAASFVERKARQRDAHRCRACWTCRALYDLDRLDLEAATQPRRRRLQDAVTDAAAPAARARSARRPPAWSALACSSRGDPSQLIYSFTLYERGEQRQLCASRPTTWTSRSTSTRAPSWTWARPPSCAR